MSAPRRVLGIDPGSRITGFGVVDLHGQHRQYVASGCIRAPEGAPLPERIRAILTDCDKLLEAPDPRRIAQINMEFFQELAASSGVTPYKPLTDAGRVMSRLAPRRWVARAIHPRAPKTGGQVCVVPCRRESPP